MVTTTATGYVLQHPAYRVNHAQSQKPTGTMKKFIGSIKDKTSSRSKSRDESGSSSSFSRRKDDGPIVLPQGDAPEAVVVREVVAFCNSGAPDSQGGDDEYLHLPAIVDAAESSPAAASAAANTLRRYLSKSYYDKGYAQYNAIMLMRILTDNPGSRFTKNFDKDFVKTVKEMLHDCKDASVQQILRETLDHFEVEKLRDQETLVPLIEMWRKEKGASARIGAGGGSTSGRSYSYSRGPGLGSNVNFAGAMPTGRGQQQGEQALPRPDELAARIEEAKSSARLLVQMVQSTPPSELLGNDLIKEFSERARQAHRSVQGYMAAENPGPDEATMLTLIETSEQLNIAMTKHQRAVLNAKRLANSPQPQTTQQNPFDMGGVQDGLPQQTLQPQYQANSFQSGFNRQPRNTFASNNEVKQPTTTVSALSQNSNSSTYTSPAGPPPSQNRPDIGAKQYTNPAPNQTYGTSAFSSSTPVQPVNNNTSMNPNYSSGLSQVRNATPPQPATSTTFVPKSPTATQHFGVADNPFEDDYAVPGSTNTTVSAPAQNSLYEMPATASNTSPIQSRNPYAAQLNTSNNTNSGTGADMPNQSQSGYSVFNRAAGQLQQAQPHNNSVELPAPHTSNYSYGQEADDVFGAPDKSDRRSGAQGYQSQWAPTPSFLHRQESSGDHLNMSGAGGR